MASAISIISYKILPSLSPLSSPPPPSSPCFSLTHRPTTRVLVPHINPKIPTNGRSSSLICKAAEYKFPDPIPEFAEAETEKFQTHLLNKLPKRKELFGDSVDEIVGICTEIFTTFLHSEYGGPGTLLVEPFIDMADTINERGLPGGPQAARAAIKWATKYVDNDWKEWTGTSKK